MRKETRIIIGAVLLFGIGLPVFLFSSDGLSSPIVITDANPAAAIVPFTKLTQGEQSVVKKRVNYVLTSPTQLSELWKTVNATGQPPEIDFKTHAVIAVFAGQEPISAIAVEKIEDSDTRMVSIMLTKPAGACAEIRSTASPYEIVAMSTTSLPLAHEDISTTVNCPE